MQMRIERRDASFVKRETLGAGEQGAWAPCLAHRASRNRACRVVPFPGNYEPLARKRFPGRSEAFLPVGRISSAVHARNNQ